MRNLNGVQGDLELMSSEFVGKGLMCGLLVAGVVFLVRTLCVWTFWFISFGVDSPPSPSSALRAQPWKPPLVTLPNACLARPLGLL